MVTNLWRRCGGRTTASVLAAKWFGLAGAAALGLMVPEFAQAAFLSGDMLDAAADVVAIIVLIVVPVVVLVVFWIVHILPEKIAEKRHHPQKDAINTLCVLSLFFGGILWPLAWLWAYSRPVAYRMAYGTDKHDDYFVERGKEARQGELLQAEIEHLRSELDAMAERGRLPPNLETLRRDLHAEVATPKDAPAPKDALAPPPKDA
jgi:CBS domain containing-hemolysin-like protein